MKKLISPIGLVGAMLSCVANAAGFSATNLVSTLRSHDSSVSQDWFAVDGFTSAGTCGTYGGLVVVRLKDDDRAKRHFSILLAAKAAKQKVTVQVDDTIKDQNGFCYLYFLQPEE